MPNGENAAAAPNDGVLEPKAGVVVDAPKDGVVDAPNPGVVFGVVAAPKGPDPMLPKVGGADVLVAPKVD